MLSLSIPCLGNIYIYIYFQWRIYYATEPKLYLCFYWYVFASYTLSVFLCLCMLYNLTVGYTSPWYFVLYLSFVWIIPPLRHCYICVCINMFLNVIYMVTVICLCTSYNPLLGCATYLGIVSLFTMPFFPSSLTCIHNSGLTYLCLNYLSHELKNISLILFSQYLIYLFILYSFSVVSLS